MTQGKNGSGCTGFSLVEVVVAGMVACIIGVVILTVNNLFFTQMNHSTLRARMQMNYDVVSNQIGASVRVAHLVLDAAEDPNGTYDSSATSTSIHLTNSAGADIAAYRIDNYVLQEFTSNAWKNFLVAGRTITLTQGSNFTLTPDRKHITLNLAIQANYITQSDSLFITGDRYVCRN